ncbi:3-isopropylmalate dehydratase large subunit [Halalkalibacter alkaliphilus]|uniref:aconitate hydratase n=1 Tax=Halalkalibacter alkaliphilus TaxID=2917993 RepID=A0A9X2CV18_9BACI|nr:aconitase/3-isopropylmalate dehydratase large subunit family protein [Halalkalibacter alkaliphilus]MCL7748547.1 3-isopropylmalate dehydratase large subunit [Halalkalibacter alkaliphilus]
MNLVEKILARASGRTEVVPGDVVVANVDTLLLHDLSGYITSRVFEKEVQKSMQYPERVVMVFDHHFSPPNEERARLLEANREFAKRHGINLFDCGSGNIHHVGVRNGFVRPGTIVVGSDSHTSVHGALGCFATGVGNNSHAAMMMPYGKTWFKVPETIQVKLHGEHKQSGVTPRDVALWLNGEIGEGGAVYKAIEFTGPYIKDLEMWDRWLFPLITIDLGGKCAYIEPDEKTVAFVKQMTNKPFDVVNSDPDTEYESVLEFDVSNLAPQIAASPTVGNVKSVEHFCGEPVHWAELGGHGGGRIEDIRQAAQILRGKKIAPGVKFNIVPSSREVFTQACHEGLVSVLHEAGCTWFPPSAGSNQAINMGAMSATEAMISTHARNFPGRNGSPDAKMYLGSAYTVAASALKGKVADPRQFLVEEVTVK